MKMVGHLLEEKPSYQIQYAKGLSFFLKIEASQSYKTWIGIV